MIVIQSSMFRVMQPAAVEAAHSWQYRPFLLNGEPVQAHTTIHVEFDPY